MKKFLEKFFFEYENYIFAFVIFALSVDLWIKLWDSIDLYFYLSIEDLIDSSFLYFCVTFFSALYMSIICFILILPKTQFSRFTTLTPNCTATVGGFGVYLINFLPTGSTSEFQLALGICLLLIGVLFVLWALAYLGRAFSVTPHASKLVMKGPYSIVRHPMYVGNIVSLVGLALIFNSLSTYLFCAVFTALQVFRAHFEEDLMQRSISGYDEYKSKVGRFFPKIRSICIWIVVFFMANLTQQTTPAIAGWEAQCAKWSKTVRLKGWFSPPDQERFYDYEAANHKGPKCRALEKRQDPCGEMYISFVIEEISRKRFVTKLSKQPYCLSFIGPEACAEVQKFVRSSSRKPRRSVQKLLKRCLQPRAGASGLLRAAL